MLTIYIDVLIIINIYVTFFLIKSTALFMHLRISRLRYILSSLIGGFSSMVIFLPSMNWTANILVKLVFGLVISSAAFSFSDYKKWLRQFIVFMMVNLIFAGVMMLIYLLAAPIGMVYNNGFVYFDISFFTITISTILSYFLIKLIRYFIDIKSSVDRKYCIEIVYNSEKAIVEGFADSGNSLVDFTTGLPVIICNKKICCKAIPDNIDKAIDGMNIKGLRLIPYSTIGKSGIVIAYKSDKVTICSENLCKDVDVLIGISENNDNKEAVFNPKILI